eukprot:9415232-Alexandrium_andersonii.AAC.1
MLRHAYSSADRQNSTRMTPSRTGSADKASRVRPAGRTMRRKATEMPCAESAPQPSSDGAGGK